jgi:hypothetical protein
VLALPLDDGYVRREFEPLGKCRFRPCFLKDHRHQRTSGSPLQGDRLPAVGHGTEHLFTLQPIGSMMSHLATPAGMKWQSAD